MLPCRQGDCGPVVAEIRAKLAVLGLDSDGDSFGADTDRAVRAFQQHRGLRVDGVVGALTYRALNEAHWQLGDRILSYVVGHPFVGDDVVELQTRLHELGFDPGRSDGIFGAATVRALQEFQRGVGLPPDGTLGPATLAALRRLEKHVKGGSASARREEERLRLAGSLHGRVAMIDPGHGGQDPGGVAHGLIEADIVLDLAARLEGRLAVLGVRTHLTRGPDTSPDETTRARLANEVGADLAISLHVDRSPSPHPCGVATAYYGAIHRDRGLIRSAVGERLARLVQSEIVSRTDLLDCRTHAKAWELLRLTRMPAIRVDVGYLTNPADATKLATAQFRDTVAEAVAAAVQRLYLPDLDVPTGQIQLAAVTG